MHFRKQNLPPVKQGVFYQLSLSKNNGPFLSKDIMYNNPKSNTLLPSPSVLHEHRKMAETLAQLERNAKMQPAKDQSTENFTAVLAFCEAELASCASNSEALQAEERVFRQEIERLYDRVSSSNNQLLEESMPVLRGLMRKVKETNQADKAEYYKVQKELQSLEMQKRSLEHVVLSCRLRIEDLEKAFVGTVSRGTDSPAFLTTSSLPQ